MEIRVTTDLGDFFDGVLNLLRPGFGIKLLIRKDNVKTFIKLDYFQNGFSINAGEWVLTLLSADKVNTEFVVSGIV
jgi:hypothetical protein